MQLHFQIALQQNVAQILEIPSISSFPVFATPKVILILLILLNILLHIQNIMIIVLYLLDHQYIIEKKI